MYPLNECVTCKNNIGKMFCVGCKNFFCAEHYADHCQNLDRNLNALILERDLLETVLNSDQGKFIDDFIDEINEWETRILTKVKQAADHARQDVRKILEWNQLENELDLQSISNQLIKIKETKNYLEYDLERIRKKINQLNERFFNRESLTNIHINKLYSERIEWQRLITVQTGSRDPSSSRLPERDEERQYTDSLDLTGPQRWANIGTTIIGKKEVGTALDQLHDPHGIAIDHRQGRIFIGDHCNHRVLMICNDSNTKDVLVIGDGRGGENQRLRFPTDVLFDSIDESVYISDLGNRRVVKCSLLDPNHTLITIVDNIQCCGLAMNSDGALYITDTRKHAVLCFARDSNVGVIVAGGNGKGTDLNQLHDPYYVAVDNDHTVYVSDNGNQRITKWIKGAREGVVLAGPSMPVAIHTPPLDPQGIVADTHGNIFVADGRYHRIVRYSIDTNVWDTIIFDNSEVDDEFQLKTPIGLDFDQKRNLYVVDKDYHRVKCFSIQNTTSWMTK